MSSQTVVSQVDPPSREGCPTCGTPYLRRLQRRGFMQKFVYSLLGYYPWECPVCRVPVYLKDRHQRRSTSRSE
jgi:hypothetical protein